MNSIKITYNSRTISDNSAKAECHCYSRPQTPSIYEQNALKEMRV